VLLHRRPFGRDDAEDHGIAKRSVRQALVIAEDAILFRAETRDRLARGEVEEARAKLDGDAGERLERMREQQELRFRVERRALDPLRVPRVADFQPPMHGVHVEIACAADDVVGRRIADDERQRALRRAHVERSVDIFQRLVRRGNARVPQSPQLAVGRCRLEPRFVLARERLERDVRATQYHRFDERHATSRCARGTRRARRGARPARS
jgi:hypothetical protein